MASSAWERESVAKGGGGRTFRAGPSAHRHPTIEQPQPDGVRVEEASRPATTGRRVTGRPKPGDRSLVCRGVRSRVTRRSKETRCKGRGASQGPRPRPSRLPDCQRRKLAHIERHNPVGQDCEARQKRSYRPCQYWNHSGGGYEIRKAPRAVLISLAKRSLMHLARCDEKTRVMIAYPCMGVSGEI